MKQAHGLATIIDHEPKRPPPSGITRLRRGFAERVRKGWRAMTEPARRLSERVDARNLWLPVTSMVAIAALLVMGGRMYERVSTRADSAVELAAELKSVNKQLGELKGSMTTLLGIHKELAQLSSDVGGLQSRLDAQDRRLETMDVWIHDTREMMQDEGLKPPSYPPRGRN